MTSIMELTWSDNGDGDNPFTQENVGGNNEPAGEEIADRMNCAAGYLVEKYNIELAEARSRLWGRGDFFPRLELVEAEIG